MRIDTVDTGVASNTSLLLPCALCRCNRNSPCLIRMRACAEEQEAPDSADGAGRTLERVRVKRVTGVNAGLVATQDVLTGWTSVNDWNGDVVLQPFDLFNEEPELDTADATDDELSSRHLRGSMSSQEGDTA